MPYNIYELITKSSFFFTKEQIKNIIPSIKQRDFRLFSNDLRSDIAMIINKENALLVKFNDISCIIMSNRCHFIEFNSVLSKKFIEYIKTLNLTTQNLINNAFENILIYLSNEIDEFLEKSFKIFKEYSIDNFGKGQLKSLLKFQHNVLFELDNYQEYLESLNNLVDNKESYPLLFNENLNFEQTLYTYSNQISEDIKNIKRLIKKVEIFLELIDISLAEKRNKFARTTLNLEICSFTYSISLFSTYLLGSNLKNNMENSDYALPIFTVVTLLFNIPIFFILRKIFM